MSSNYNGVRSFIIISIVSVIGILFLLGGNFIPMSCHTNKNKNNNDVQSQKSVHPLFNQNQIVSQNEKQHNDQSIFEKLLQFPLNLKSNNHIKYPIYQSELSSPSTTALNKRANQNVSSSFDEFAQTDLSSDVSSIASSSPFSSFAPSTQTPSSSKSKSQSFANSDSEASSTQADSFFSSDVQTSSSGSKKSSASPSATSSLSHQTSASDDDSSSASSSDDSSSTDSDYSLTSSAPDSSSTDDSSSSSSDSDSSSKSDSDSKSDSNSKSDSDSSSSDSDSDSSSSSKKTSHVLTTFSSETNGKTVIVTQTSVYTASSSSEPSASSGNSNKSDDNGGLSHTNKIVVGVVVGIGGSILIGIISILFYLKKRNNKSFENGGWTFWRSNEKNSEDNFLNGELGVRDRNINQGSNF